MQKKPLCSRSRSGNLKQPGRASAVRKADLGGVGWPNEVVGEKVKWFQERLWGFLNKREIQTHQTAAGRQAGRVCLTTGFESSPPLA